MSTTQDTTATARTRRVSLWLTIALVVAALGVGGLLGVLTTSRDDAPEIFTFGGMFALEDIDGFAVNGSHCVGEEGYDDISAGAQVTVYDRSGAVLAIGGLGPGLVDDGYNCVFRIRVEKVPAGHGLYQVEVSHRGKVAFSEAEGLAGDVTLTLG